MRKSIYYLIANILSTIAAAIFIGVVNFQYPFFGTDFIVTGMSQNCWEPLKIVLPVVALSIIYVTRDVVVHKDGKQDTGLDKTINVIMGIITTLSVLYTWFAAILEYDHYAINVKINFPIIYFILFCSCISSFICCTCYQQEKSNYWFSINILKHFNRCWWCY